jgi:hypothetical protein
MNELDGLHPDKLGDEAWVSGASLATYERLFKLARKQEARIEQLTEDRAELWQEVKALREARTQPCATCEGSGRGEQQIWAGDQCGYEDAGACPDCETGQPIPESIYSHLYPGWEELPEAGQAEVRKQIETIRTALTPIIRQQALQEAKARVCEIDWDRGLPELVYSQEQEEAFRLAKRAALTAIDGSNDE